MNNLLNEEIQAAVIATAKVKNQIVTFKAELFKNEKAKKNGDKPLLTAAQVDEMNRSIESLNQSLEQIRAATEIDLFYSRNNI